jgi:hypothetical protein
MDFVEINSTKIYYYDDPDDPIVSYLKSGKLHGKVGYDLIFPYLNSKTGTVIDFGAGIGTFSIEPVLKGFQVIAIENNAKKNECLSKTFANYSNVVCKDSFSCIEELKETYQEDVVLIRYALDGHEIPVMISSMDTINKYTPLILLEVNILSLIDNGSSLFEIIDLLESNRYHCFLYNGANFLIKLDKNSRFPFCHMALVCMHESTIVNLLGKITFGSFLSHDMMNDLIRDSKKNYINEKCQQYLESIS